MLLMPVKNNLREVAAVPSELGRLVRTRSNDSLPPPGRELVYNNAVVI